MKTLIVLILLAAAGANEGRDKPPKPPKHAEDVEALIQRVSESGRVLLIAEKPSERLRPAVKLAPGTPPLLAFRYFDGERRHRFGKLDLVMDDAGH